MPPRTSKKKASSSKESAPQTPKRKSRNEEETSFTPAGTPSQSLSESLFSLSASQAQLSQFLDEGEEVSDVLSGAYISESIASTDFTERMKKVADILKGMGQLATPEDAPWDELFLANLIDKKIISNKSEAVKVYAARAIVDVLRVTAPDCPFDEEDLPKIFRFIIDQIEALSQGSGSLFSQRFYLLERLSTVKIFIMLANYDECEALIIPLFESLFRIVTECETNQPQKIISYICDIMISVIESVDTIDAKLIEVLIQPLLENRSKLPSEEEEAEEKNEQNDEESHFSAKHIAKNVLDKTQEHISTQLNDYLNDILKELENTKDKTKSSFKKKRARVFSLIYEINLVSSRLLLTVIPNLCIQLKDEDVQVRSAVIQLLGNMFKAKDSELFREYPNIFETDFLSRFNDKDSRVRIYMSKFANGMIKNHPVSSKVLNEKLAERMMDPDEKVRRNVVETVVNVAMDSPALISDETMQKLQERTRDKKSVLRLHTLSLCAQLYNHHATEVLKTSDSWENTTSDRLAWIPNNVIKYYAEQHEQVIPHRLFIEKLIDETLLDQGALRSKTLLDIYRKLDDMAKQVLESIISQKKVFQTLVTNLLELDTENNDSQIISTLSSLLSDESLGKRIWKEISSRRNKQSDDTIKVLKSCLNINSSFKDVTKLKKKGDDKLVGDKKEEKDYMKSVIQRLAMTIFTKEQANDMIELAQKFSNSSQHSMALSTMHLLNVIVQFYPSLGKDTIVASIELMEKEEDYEINLITLKVLSYTAVGLEKTKFSLASDLEEKLVSFCTKGKPKEVKRAATVITKAFIAPENIFSKILLHAKDNLDYGEQLLTALAAIRQVIIHTTEMFRTHEEEIMDFVLNHVVLWDREERSTEWSSLSLDTETKIQALKLLVDYTIACAKEGVTSESESVSSKLVGILFDLLIYKGSIKAILEKDLEKSDKMDTTEEEDTEEAKKKDSNEKKIEIDRAALRLIAVKSIITLTKSSDFKLKMERFLQLAFTSLDPILEVRKGLLEKLFKELRKAQLGNAFSAILLLFVGDKNSDLAVRAKKYFSKLVPLKRALIARTKGLTLTSRSAYDIFPEYILPYLVFLLSRHPLFASEEPQFLTFQKILYAYFDEVTHDIDNLSFFHQLITKLKQRKDVINPKSVNHLVICDMAISIVNRCAENSGIAASSVPFPGKIFVPSFFKISEGEEDGSNIDTIKTLYLPSGFKLNEKLARQVQPTEKQSKQKKTTPVEGEKKRKRNTTKSSTSTKKKKTEKEEEPSKRSLPSRSAKQNRKKIEESEEESEHEEEEESEQESDKEESNESEEEETTFAPRTAKKKQSKEPAQSVTSKKKKKF